jgi:hypothetical protein
MRNKNKNKNKSNNSRFLTSDKSAFHIRQSIDGTQHIIDKCMEHYDKTGDLAALQVAFDGYVQLGKMLTKVREQYSYGNKFDLTK